MEVILYSKECNWYTRCCPLNGGVRYRECPLSEAILYMHMRLLPLTNVPILCINTEVVLIRTSSTEYHY